MVYIKFAFYVSIGILVATIFWLPFIEFKDDKDNKEYKKNNKELTYLGTVKKTDCNNDIGNAISYVEVDNNKFELDYLLCKRLSKDSLVEVKYNNRLKVKDITYVKGDGSNDQH